MSTYLRKLCFVGTGVCAACSTWSAHFVNSAKTISDDGSIGIEVNGSRFQIDHITKRGLQLKMIQVFFRHGARTPLNLLANPTKIPELEQVWDKNVLFSGGEGLLADYVVKDLGGGPALKNHFDAIHKTVLFKYEPEHIYIRSSNFNRTIESAACVLAGMFGNEINKKGSVSIFVATATDDIMYPNYNACGRLSVLTKNMCDVNITREMRRKIEPIQGIFGISQCTRQDLFRIRDVMSCQKAHGIPIMDIINQLSDFIEECAVNWMKEIVSQPGKHRLELLQMSGGRIVQMLKDNMQQLIQSNKIYTAHSSPKKTFDALVITKWNAVRYVQLELIRGIHVLLCDGRHSGSLRMGKS
ncbi:lysophosphatidic acid phosphatase type 6-like [Saccoglossus kowalevskii]